MEPITHQSAKLLVDAAMSKLRAESPGVTGVVESLVDLSKPGESAISLMGTAILNAQDHAWPATVVDIVRVLVRQQCHLSYLDGQDDGYQNAQALINR